MNSHDSIAPTKVGNPRTESAARRSLSLRDLFLSLAYGLLFGSLAFLTGCLEGGQYSRPDSQYPAWGTQDFEDEELNYLNASSLEDRLQYPFSQDKPPTEWATAVAGSSDEFELALGKQTGPLVLHLTGSVTLTKEYVVRFPIWIDATPTSLYPDSKLIFGTLGAISIKAAEARVSKCFSSNGRFDPGAMSYLGLFGDIKEPRIQVVVNSSPSTDVHVEATAKSLLVSRPGQGQNAGKTSTIGVDHTVLLSGTGTATDVDAHSLRPILGLVPSHDLPPNSQASDWCLRSFTLGNYVMNLGYSGGSASAWKQSNRYKCEWGGWKNVVTTAWSCDSAMPTTGGVQ